MLTAWDDAADDFSDLAPLVAELTGFAGEIAWDDSGFRPSTPLREGPERTLAWYRD